MAKRKKKAGGNLGDFAEKLGTLLGNTERTARSWIDQRKEITAQLTEVRDKADRLLRELAGGAANVAAAITRRKVAKRRARTTSKPVQHAAKKKAARASRKAKTSTSAGRR